jgi:hypothetical protein
MDENKLKYLFPRASKSFIEANAGLRPSQSQHVARKALVDPAQGKEKGDARALVSYVLYRVRLLDPDNAVGATKTITDCLCQVGLISGDSADEIEIEVRQEKVKHYHDQKTEIVITYPM